MYIKHCVGTLAAYFPAKNCHGDFDTLGVWLRWSAGSTIIELDMRDELHNCNAV